MTKKIEQVPEKRDREIGLNGSEQKRFVAVFITHSVTSSTVRGSDAILQSVAKGSGSGG